MRFLMENGIRGLWLSCLALALAAAGCQTGQLPDPNAEEGTLGLHPEYMKENLAALRRSLDQRVMNGLMTEEQRDEVLERELKEMIDNIPITNIPPKKAWHYGDLFRDAGDWEDAYMCYDIARKSAESEDRRVNDNLRFAQSAGALGKVDEAIEAARSVFDAPPQDKAPILPAILYEVVPAAKGKGKDAELAKLLEEAIQQHQQVVVDAASQPGKDFLMAKPRHIELAWNSAIDLYQEAGDEAEARAAVRRAEEMKKNSASVSAPELHQRPRSA